MTDPGNDHAVEKPDSPPTTGQPPTTSAPRAPLATSAEANFGEGALLVDGKPFPWAITTFSVAAELHGIPTLTVEIPVSEITVSLGDP